jgi:hypothetical protein
LIARFLLIIREISTALKGTLNVHHHHQVGSKSSSSSNSSSSDSDKGAVALLFLGRLAWLLKIRGQFLEHAIGKPVG